MTAAPTVYTIPPWRSFADSLAAGLLDRAEDHPDPEELTRTIMISVTRLLVSAPSDAAIRAA